MENKVLFYRAVTLAGAVTFALMMIDFDQYSTGEFITTWAASHTALTYIFLFTRLNILKRP